MKNKIITFLSTIFSIGSVYSIQVVQTTTPKVDPSNETLRTVVLWIFGLGVMFLGLVILIAIAIFIIMKIQSKIQEINRKKKDFLYYNFEENNKFCWNNKDMELIRRKKRTFGLTWKRTPVLLNTSSGLKPTGFYNGETDKKESFYMVSIHNKIGFFKYMDYIILIPYAIKKDIVKKSYIQGKKVIVLECEGIDEVGSTDYYMQPLIPDPQDKTKFIDFSELVRKEYSEKIILRNEIKEVLQESREAVIKSVETNPYVHFNRRGDK